MNIIPKYKVDYQYILNKIGITGLELYNFY